MILAAFARALPQLLLPGVRRVLGLSLLLTALLFALLGVAGWFGLRFLFVRMHWIALDGFAGAAVAGVIALVGGWLLFRGVAIAVVGLFADRIVAAIEGHDYPDRARAARAIPFDASARLALRSATRAIGWNLLALPLYLALLVTGVGTVALFLALNGYLLGRDLADLVEPRHPGLLPFSRGERWQLGLVSALLLLLPLVNLLAPVWSVAMAIHLFHRRNRAAPA